MYGRNTGWDFTKVDENTHTMEPNFSVKRMAPEGRFQWQGYEGENPIGSRDGLAQCKSMCRQRKRYRELQTFKEVQA
jgi:hypothetical protein